MRWLGLAAHSVGCFVKRLGENIHFLCDSAAEAGEHFAFGHAGGPSGAELVVGFVDEFPAASPLEAEAFAEGAEFAVEAVAAVVGLAVAAEDSEVDGKAEIVHGVACWGFGHDLAGGCAAFGVEGGLLCPCAEAADAFHIKPALCGEVLGGADEGYGAGLEIGVERGNVALAAVVERHFFLRGF